MTEQCKKSRFRKVVKYVGCSMLGLFIIFIGLFAWMATRPDAPPLDDSAMLPQCPNVPPGQNGYDAVIALDRDKKLPVYYFHDLQNLNDTNKGKAFVLSDIPESKISSLKEKYDTLYTQVQHALELPYFVIPPRQGTKPEGSEWGVTILFRMTTYAFIQARQEARAGRAHEALQHVDLAVRTGSALENSQGGFIPLHIGTIIHERALLETNAMIDYGLPMDDTHSELLRMLRDQTPSTGNCPFNPNMNLPKTIYCTRMRCTN